MYLDIKIFVNAICSYFHWSWSSKLPSTFEVLIWSIFLVSDLHWLLAMVTSSLFGPTDILKLAPFHKHYRLGRLAKCHKHHKQRLCKTFRAWVNFLTSHTLFCNTYKNKKINKKKCCLFVPKFLEMQEIGLFRELLVKY